MTDQSSYDGQRDQTARVSPVQDGAEKTGDSYGLYPYANNPESEKTIFKYLLQPDDSYTAEGIYWADLPLSKRVSFITSSEAAETSRELRTVRSLTKTDPLSPFAWYIRNAVLPGAGIGLEGYVLPQRGVPCANCKKLCHLLHW